MQEHFKPSQETQTTNRDLKLSELVFETALQRATTARKKLPVLVLGTKAE